MDAIDLYPKKKSSALWSMLVGVMLINRSKSLLKEKRKMVTHTADFLFFNWPKQFN